MKRFIILLTLVLVFTVPLLAQDRSGTVDNVVTTDINTDGETLNVVTGILVYLSDQLVQPGWTSGDLVDEEEVSTMLQNSAQSWSFSNIVWNSPYNPLDLNFIIHDESSFFIIFPEDEFIDDTGFKPIVTYTRNSAREIVTEDGNLLSFNRTANDLVKPKPLIAKILTSNASEHYVTVGDTIFFELHFSELLFSRPTFYMYSYDQSEGGYNFSSLVDVTPNSQAYDYEAQVVLTSDLVDNRDRIDFTIAFQDAHMIAGEPYTDETYMLDDGWLIFDKTAPALNAVGIEVLDDGENPTNSDVVDYLITWEEDFVYNFDVTDISCIATDINGDPIDVTGTFVIDPAPVRYDEDVVNTIQFTMDNGDFNGTVSFMIRDSVNGISDTAGNITYEEIVVADGINYTYYIDNTVPVEAELPTFSAITNSSATVNIAAVTESWYNPAGYQYKFIDAAGNFSSADYLDLNIREYPVSGLSVNTQYKFSVDVKDYAGNVTTGTKIDSFYTLANDPTLMVVNNPSTTTLDVSWDLNGSPATTEYKIMSGTNYVQTDGSLGALEVWQTATDWDVASGVTVNNLTPGTEYAFAVTGRNGDNTVTGSINGSLYTLAEVPVLASTTHPTAVYYSSSALSVEATQNNGAVSYYRYLFNQTLAPELAAVALGTDDADGVLTETIGSDGTWYMHVLAYNGNDVPCTNYATYTVNYDGSAPTELDVTIVEVGVDAVKISGTANFNLANEHETAPYKYYDGVNESDFVAADHTFIGLSENTQYTFQMKGRDNATTPNVNADWGGDESVYTLLNDLTEDNVDVTATIEGFEITVDQIPNGTAGLTGYDWKLEGMDWDESWVTANTKNYTGLAPNAYYAYGIKTRNGDGIETTPYYHTLVNYTLAEAPGTPTLDSAVATAFNISFGYGNNDSVPETMIRVEDLTDNSIWYVYYNDGSGKYELADVATNSWIDYGAAPSITLDELTSNTNYRVDIKFRNGDDVETSWSNTASIWTTLYSPVVALPNNDTANWYGTNTPEVNISQSQGTAADAYTFWATTDEPLGVTVQNVIDNGVDVETTYGWDLDPTQVFDLAGTEIPDDGTWYLYAVGYNGGGIATGEYGYTYFNYDSTSPTDVTVDAEPGIDVIHFSSASANFDLSGPNTGGRFLYSTGSTHSWTDETEYDFDGLTENTEYSTTVTAKDNTIPAATSNAGFTTVYTLVGEPTGLAQDSHTTSSITVSVDEFTNDDLGSSAYHFWIDGVVDTTVAANSYTFENLQANTEYTIYASYFNQEGEETGSINIDVFTAMLTAGTPVLSNPATDGMDIYFDSYDMSRAQADGSFAIEFTSASGTLFVNAGNAAVSVDPVWQTYTQWFGGSADPISITGLDYYTEYVAKVYTKDTYNNVLESGTDILWTLPQGVETVSSTTHPDDQVWYSSTELSLDADMGTHPVVDHFNFYVSQNATETADTVDELGTQDTDGIAYIHTFDGDDDGPWYAHAIAYNPNGNYSSTVASMQVNFDNDTPYYDEGGFTATQITSSSIEVTVAGADDEWAGLHATAPYYFEEYNEVGRVDRPAGPAWQEASSYTFNDLAENTYYTYQAKIRDNAIEPNEVTTTTAGAWTKCPAPTGLVATAQTDISITVSIDAFTNDDALNSGYKFRIEPAGINTGRIAANSYQFTGLDPNVQYTVYGSYFNADEIETAEISIDVYTNMGIAGTPVLTNPTEETIDIDFSALAQATRAQAGGDFAIVVNSDLLAQEMYVQADGSLDTTIEYLNYDGWDNGSITMSGLTRYAEYTVLIRTRDHMRGTHDSEAASLWTLPERPANVSSDTHELPTVWYNQAAMDVDVEMPAGHPTVEYYKFYVNSIAVTDAETVDSNGVVNSTGIDYIHNFATDDDGTWYVHVLAYNPDGNHSEEVRTMMVKFDNNAPTASSIVVTDTTATSLTIEVTGASDTNAGLNTDAYIYYDGMPVRDDEWTDQASWTFSDLEPNTEHNLYVGLRDAATNPNETLEGPYTVRTMAVTPAAPVVVDNGSAWVDLVWDLEGSNYAVDNLANDSGTEYALYEVNTGMYLNNSDKLESATPVWFAVPDTFAVGVLGLTPETEYEFKLIARNSADVETEMSASAAVTTYDPSATDALIHLEQDGDELTPFNEELTVGELFDIVFGIYEIDKYGQEILCYNYDSYTFFQTNYPNNLVTNSQVLFFIDGIAQINNCYVNAEIDDLYISMYLQYIGRRIPEPELFQYGPLEIGEAEINAPGSALAYDNPDDQGGWIYVNYELSENDPFYEPSAVAPYVDYYVLEREVEGGVVRDDSTIWEVVAFISPYNPAGGNTAQVLIEVPASDSVFNYRIAAVYNAEPYGRLSGDEPVVIYADEMELSRNAYSSEYASCGSANAADNIGGYADFTVFLEGAYNGGVMDSQLELPLESPYDGEVIDALPIVDGHSLIDWVQVELRTSETGAAVKSCNAFLLEDGSLVDVTGKADLPFYYTTGHDYYIVINHRNHIAVMTAESYELADFAAESTMINLASSSSAVYGNGIKDLGTGFAMYAADVTGDNFIGNDDMNTWAVNWGSTGYLNADVDLDGQVAQTDMLVWAVNWAKAGSVPANVRLADNIINSESAVNIKEFDIHYGISNAEFVEYENGDVYYEFDVIASSDKASNFYSGQVFLGYDTDIFSTMACESGNAYVNGLELVESEIDVPGPAPAINAYSVLAADFDKGILAAGSTWNPSAVNMLSYENANLIYQETQDYLHVAMKCEVIPEVEENLVWFVENDLLTDQQTYLDHENNWQSFSGISYDAYDLTTPEHEPVTVAETHITGVYPNPFNPRTTLYFELGEAADVSLEIYNIKGQKVRTVEMGDLNEGNHNISWNGTNNHGADCGSGVYFFKLNTGLTSEMTRVLMLK